ncbi:hypothetical protein HQN90_17795 [Paenibacillus alba]|uniref:hypothetical protein n=1 Tax=Paenibacillus alba TaxID=1197127 RepID=UPI00156658C4|nr:hypothetical protein [Paenibacillus alba]NQX67978.1 hypothetical protein [Paenibacillus alba]
MIRFADLLRRYSVACVIIRIKNEWNADGEAVKKEERTQAKMPILPIDSKLMQIEGGRYTMIDKTIYSLNPLRIGDIIEHKGGRHTIDQEADYSEFADFNKYIAKRVSTHG